jgi:predicted PurR-regulated permease PerM
MTGPLERRWAQIVGIALIVVTSLLVLRPFVTPIAWAAILAYASWPLHARMDRVLGGRTGLSALAMTLLMVLVVMVPAVLVSAALVVEIQTAFETLRAWLPSGPASLARTLRDVPLFGTRLAELFESIAADPAQMQQWVLARSGLVVGLVASTAGDLGRLALNAILILLALFYFFRHGGEIVPELHGAARRLAGGGVDTVIHTLGETVRAVMYGTLSTALAQALLLALGVWIVGLGSPVLLGAITGLLALTPIGPPLIYVPAAAWLLVQGRIVAGLVLLGWGVFVVSMVDNIIKSWFLSGAARIPFLLGFFGVLGGLLAFGPIGLFLGPVAIALLLTLWREWTRARIEPGDTC